jgi:hypothetical protein
VSDETQPVETNKILFEAIALRKCITVVYNRVLVTLAPHILYTRHGELFIDAVTVERGGQPPKELKLGTYKLTGLKDVTLLSRGFHPQSVFDPNGEKYQGVTLFAIENP